MIYIDEVSSMKLLKKKFYLPIDMKDKKHNNYVLLLSPNYDSSVRLLQNPLILNKYYNSYYIEKDVMYIINHEGYIDIDNTKEFIEESNKVKKIKSEDGEYYKCTRKEPNKLSTLEDIDKVLDKKSVELEENYSDIFIGYTNQDKIYGENKSYIKYNNEDNTNTLFVLEDSVFNTKIKKLLYQDRLRNNREVFDIYNMIKQDVPYISNTFIDLAKYKNKNLYVDTFYYNNLFKVNNTYSRDKGIELYFDLLDRFITDDKLTKIGYNQLSTVLVPVIDWIDGDDYLDYHKNVNLLSMIVRLATRNSSLLQKWKGLRFVFMTSKGYFVCDPSTLNKKTIVKFKVLLNKLIANDPIEDTEENIDSKKAIVTNITDRIENGANIKLYKLTGDTLNDNTKKEIIDTVDKVANTAANTDDALDQLDKDERLKKILADLAQEEENQVKLSNARSSRMIKAQDKSKDKMVNGVTIRELLNRAEEDSMKELPKTELNIDSVNPEWKDLRYINFEESYNLDEDILNMLYSLNDLSDPIAVLDVDVKDTSTSEDAKETYTVKLENSRGERFTIKFDIPKFIDNKFMRLRGNGKTINGQLTLIPILKTDQDTVQMISNYKKIFIYRYGSSVGKSYPSADIVYKVLKKYKGTKTKIVPGDNTIICTKYELAIDYLDLASVYNTIENQKFIIYFNQDTIRNKYKVDESVGLPIAYDKANKGIVYWKSDEEQTCSDAILSLICTDDEVLDLAENTKVANKYMYSRANILNNKIPLIIVMAHSEGLEKSMQKAGVDYNIQEKRPKATTGLGVIKFKDAYLTYRNDYNSSLLMNGLKECPTEEYSITEINNKAMYIDFLDIFGGRLLSDGLDNFYDLFIDPITDEVLERYKLPRDYVELLAYANFLLADNKYIKHTDMSSRRYRSNELVAGYTYQALAESYGNYRTEYKKRGSATMTMKQSAVIDKVMLDPTCADMSELNDVQNAEAINALTYKGLAGLNHDRSYDLEKRCFDSSMLNSVAMSTGFAGNVGVTRQSTIDMNIEGKRGYIKTIDNDFDQMSITKTFGITEAMTPFGCTRDDPMRTAMNFVQTSKHQMRIKQPTPMLISNGADMALPYITSNAFSFNAKEDGKVIEITDDYMILEYKSGKHDFVDLRNNVKKNSNGGFYQTIKLDTDLKVGNRIKKNEIVAYDKMSYSNIVGPTDDLAYSCWALCKVAMINTDEGFEDSAIITEWLSEALASEVVVKKECVLPKNTNVYFMADKDQPIQEGDSLLIFQNAFEEDDVNMLLKNLGDDEDIISDLGRIPIKSKVTGKIQDIKIYRTVEKDELSDSLRKIVNKYEKPVNDMKKTMEKYDVYDPSKLEPTYALDKSGKLKNVDDGVLIEFYLSYYDKMSIGDKLIYYDAVKGVTKDVIPHGKEPYSEFRPDEPIHSYVPYFGVANRLVSSIYIVMVLNKALIELDRKVKEMCDIPYKYLDGSKPKK